MKNTIKYCWLQNFLALCMSIIKFIDAKGMNAANFMKAIDFTEPREIYDWFVLFVDVKL